MSQEAGFKLEKALITFDIKVQDRICFDAGASTVDLQIACFKTEPKRFMPLM